MITRINTIQDVKEFARQLIAEGSNFHPDDDFEDYVNYETGIPKYSPEDAALRNELMAQCFKVCESVDEDVYGIMLDVMLIETGMSKYIPLSTAEVA